MSEKLHKPEAGDPVLEQLSALADDELDAAEARLLFARIEREPALREAWTRYHLTGEAMRGSLASHHAPGLANRVMAALAEEQTPRRRLSGGWLKPVAGLAVAASVATVAVLGFQQPGTGPMPAEVVPQTSGSGSMVTLPYTDLRSASWGEEQNRSERELAPYLERHNRYAAHRSVQGMLPYAHIVVYQPRRDDGEEDGADRGAAENTEATGDPENR